MSGPREVLKAAGFDPSLLPIAPPKHDPTLALEIFAQRFKSSSQSGKEPLLLLHGHPQNSLIYHRLGPQLAKSASRDLVIADLRGHGHSTAVKVRNYLPGDEEGGVRGATPSEEALRSRYSKREMGRDMVQTMKLLGYEKFSIVGHDRGGRIAYRMAIDYPDVVVKAMLLDIAPTYDLYEKAGSKFALAYWHWYFLPQPYPFSEDLLLRSPSAYLEKLLGRFSNLDPELFPKEVIDSYTRQLSSPPRVHATCEDYRASAPGGIDLEQDEADRKANRKVKQPVRVLWGTRGINEALFGHEGMLKLWSNVCEQVSGRALECGHYIPEEVPQELEKEILDFF